MDRTNESSIGYTYGGQSYKKESRTDSQGNTYTVDIPVSNVIPVSSLTQPAVQIRTPQPAQPINYTQQTLDITSPYMEQSQMQNDLARQQSEMSDIQALSRTLAGRTGFEAEQNQALGLNQASQDYITKSAELAALNKQAAAAQQENIAQGRQLGSVASFVAGQGSEIERNRAIRALTIGAELDAIQGNIAVAQMKVKNAVDAKYAPIEAELQLRKQFFDMNDKLMQTRSQEEQKQWERAKYAVERQDKKIAEEKKNFEDIQNMIVEATPNAPADVIARAKKLAEQGGSKLAVAQALGVYGGDYLKNELLREQLKQARVKTSTISADGRELVTQNGVQLVKVTPKEIQDLNDTQIAKNSLVSLVDNMIGSIDKYGTQVLFGKEAGTRSGAKTNLLLAMKNLEKTGALDKGTIDVLSGTIPESEFFATEAAQKAALQQLRDTVVNKTDEYINSYKGTTAETDPRTKRIYEQTGFVSTGNPQADEYIRQSMGAVSSVNNSMSTPNAINAGYVDNQK